ncbi:hypothetical protein ACFWXH_19450 [Mesorhizobium sp. NPDC059054]|uniref:hypothetical protein n=1 Tax=Mesorhizobium sp. NPDC059054 TaxID=3346711 RepID=UPI0036A07D31
MSIDWLKQAVSAENIQLASVVITAFATAVLGVVTWVLAKETKVLSRATAQAHVTATLEPNLWAVNHVDLIVENSGNAVAYAIDVQFDPPLPSGKSGSSHRSAFETPLQHVSLLRPGQSIRSNLCEFALVSRKDFSVSTSWKPHPNAKDREKLSYRLSMNDYHDVSYLGARSPWIQIAEQIKGIREDWKPVARGSRRIQADTHSGKERAVEEKASNALFEQMREELTKPKAGPVNDPAKKGRKARPE